MHMLAKTLTCAVVGLDGYVVEVEVDISPGLPAFHVVGLPDTAVQEARERVRAAIRNSGCEFPMRRIAASLAPADLRKAGPSYDLPIALAVLMGSGQLSGTPPLTMFLGELALDGQLRHTNGILSMTAVAKEEGFQRVFVPEPNARRGRARGRYRGDSRPLPGAGRGAPARRRADTPLVAPRGPRRRTRLRGR